MDTRPEPFRPLGQKSLAPAGMTYVNIQGMRAVASLMVFVAHVFWPVETMRTHWAAPYVDMLGPAGVDIFFVISGFIIYTVASRSGEKSGGTGRFRTAYEFAVKRLLRIYPIYWLAFLAAAITSIYIEIFPSWIPASSTISQFFLLGTSNNHIQAAWTLTYEIYFYAVATFVLFVAPRHLMTGLMSWFGLIFLVNVTAYFLNKDWMFLLPFSSILFEFMFGVIIAWLIRNGVTKYSVRSLIIGAFLFPILAMYFHKLGGWNAVPSWWRLACFGVPSALIIYGIVGVEVRGQWRFPKMWEGLGDISYSLYLWHQLLFYVLFALAVQTGLAGLVSPTLLSVIFMTLVLIFAFGSYQVELKLNDIGGRLLIGKRIELSKMAKD